MPTMSPIKKLILSIVDGLPDDSSYDEILKELTFVRMIRRSLDDFDHGQTISNEEMLKRIEQWALIVN